MSVFETATTAGAGHDGPVTVNEIAGRARERSTLAQTLPEVVLRAAELHRGVALRERVDGRQAEITYAQLGERVREIARGLAALGVEPGDHVAILANTRADWTVADFGALCAGAVVVPIYQTSSPAEIEYVLEHSESRVVFCEDPAQLAKVEQVRASCPLLEHAVLMTGEGEGAITTAELVSRGRAIEAEEIDRRVAATSPDDLATLVYTSGTTGPPKGCMLSHGNFLATARLYEEQLTLYEGELVIFMFLPLAHALARVTQMVVLDLGGTLAFWSRDPARILADLQEANPTHVPSVPRVFEKIYTAAQVGIEEGPAVKRAIARWALRVGAAARQQERAGRPLGSLGRARLALADKVVLSKVRALFGSRLKLALTGAAPIAKDVLEFFDSCGVLVLEGYGMTETTAAATLNTERAFRFGSVGRPLRECTIDVAVDREILIGGPNVFLGYFKNDEATHDTIDPMGRVRTGDLGSVDEDGFTFITGRKKDLIITSSGKNITPTNIENQLRECRWISQAVVFGDNRPYIVAALTLDPDEAPALAERLEIESDIPAMAENPRVREELQKAIDEANEHFARIEQVKRFTVLPRDLTLADGELTPTLKIKRQLVYERYAGEFAALYEG